MGIKQSKLCRKIAGGAGGLSLALSLALALIASTASAAVTGTKCALVMLVSMTNAPIDCTVGELNVMVFTNLPLNVDSFYNDATWGGVCWTGSVVNVSINFGSTTGGMSLLIAPTNSAAFYRILGQ